MRRAGLDYWDLLTIHHYDSLDHLLATHDRAGLVLFSSKAHTVYTEPDYPRDAFLVFGSETAGLDEAFLRDHPGPVVRIPTVAPARSLNLSNAVAVAAYECARQHAFAGLETRRATLHEPGSSQGAEIRRNE